MTEGENFEETRNKTTDMEPVKLCIIIRYVFIFYYHWIWHNNQEGDRLSAEFAYVRVGFKEINNIAILL